MPLDHAFAACRNDRDSRLPIFPPEPHALLADGTAGNFATCLCRISAWRASSNGSTLFRTLSTPLHSVKLDGPKSRFRMSTSARTRILSATASRCRFGLPRQRARTSAIGMIRRGYDTQTNAIFPTIVCPTCSSRHPDGVVVCIECSTCLEPHSDQSIVVEYAREREDAVRKNRPANPMLLMPGTVALTAIASASDSKALRSTARPPALHPHPGTSASRWSKRGEACGLGDLENIVENTIDAYNTSRVGMSVSSLAELSTCAHIRIPDIGERAKGGAGRHGTQQVVGAGMAIVWPAGSTQLDLLTKCLI